MKSARQIVSAVQAVTRPLRFDPRRFSKGAPYRMTRARLIRQYRHDLPDDLRFWIRVNLTTYSQLA